MHYFTRLTLGHTRPQDHFASPNGTGRGGSTLRVWSPFELQLVGKASVKLVTRRSLWYPVEGPRSNGAFWGQVLKDLETNKTRSLHSDAFQTPVWLNFRSKFSIHFGVIMGHCPWIPLGHIMTGLELMHLCDITSWKSKSAHTIYPIKQQN